MKVLVTGANGFLGRHVVSEFLRRGHHVRALIRPAAKTSTLPTSNPRLQIFRADLRASSNLPDAFAPDADGPVDACVHLAAAVTGPEDAQFAATVVGTEKLLAAMATAGTCRRLVLASSFSVYDWSQIRGTLTESSPLESEQDLYDRDGYAVSKLWQERTARRLAQDHHWILTILRPGFIWGPGNADLSGIGQRVGPLYLVFGPSRKLPLTHVENCAHAFVTATEHACAASTPTPATTPTTPWDATTASPSATTTAAPQNNATPQSPETFNVLDDHLPSAWSYAGDYLRHTGTRSYRLPIPYPLAITTTRLARKISKLLFNGKGKLPSILVPCRFEARFKPLKFTNTHLKSTLHWTPPLSHSECLRRTYTPDTDLTRPSSPGTLPVARESRPRHSERSEESQPLDHQSPPIAQGTATAPASINSAAHAIAASAPTT